ncbi:6-bladed beta-propeller [Parabacteroides sp.]
MKYIGVLMSILLSLSLQAKDKVLVIDMTKAKVGDIPLSRLASHLEYIPLELTKESLLNKPSVFLTDRYIITTEFAGKICLFDRKNGKYIRRLSQEGGGPDDYAHLMSNCTLDKERNVFYVDIWKKWRGIDIETNKCVNEVVKPEYRYIKETRFQQKINNLCLYKDSLYLGFANDEQANDHCALYVFNKNGEVLKVIDNGLQAPTFKSSRSSCYNAGRFQEVGSNLYFSGASENDTVYLVGEERLIPSIAFHFNETLGKKYETGKLDFGADDVETVRRYKKGFLSYSRIFQEDRYIFFACSEWEGLSSNISFSNYYDKKTKQLYSCKREGERCGFVNDIDGLGTFFMEQLEGNKLVGLLMPEDLLDYMETHKDVKLSPTGKKVLENLQFDDNPIVVIATLKE